MAPRACPLVLLALLAACSPTLDWREVRPEGSNLVALFPCRPDKYDRRLELAGLSVRMRMQSCAAGGQTFAISHFELADPAAMGSAMRALRHATAANLGVTDPPVHEWPVAGANVQPEAGRTSIDGRLPDGRPVHAENLVFATGLRVHQASVVGEARAGDTADAFFAGIKVAP